ncbi:hypothetical protein HYX18_00490 [Candidatus Woesearchaeota archaeon]|nr:hypothetical protein [Candidatus Woesearchaeota archaeon]
MDKKGKIILSLLIVSIFVATMFILFYANADPTPIQPIRVNATIIPPPNSCADNDGGINEFVKGTTSGYINGLPYSYTDFCINTTRLYEYYCLGSYSFNVNITCRASANLTGFCVNGACT